MSLEKNYKTILSEIQQSNLSESAKALVESKNYSSENWLKGLAILSSCSEINPEIKTLFETLFEKGRSKRVSLFFDDADYLFFFNKGVEVCTKIAELGHAKAWDELAHRYTLVRKQFLNPELEISLYKKGIEEGNLECMASYAYTLLTKEQYSDKKDEGVKLLEKAKKAGLNRAFEISFAINLRSNDIPTETLIKDVENYIASVNNKEDKSWASLGEIYLIKNNDYNKAVECFMKVEDSVLSRYHLGLLILNGYTNALPIEKGIELLDSVAYYPEAAYRLGIQDYRDKNTEKAKEWYNTAIKYSDHAASMFELSMISIYDEKNKQIGMPLLEKAIDLNYAPALLEKSFLTEDNNEAKTLLEKSVELGNMYAPYHLGLGYQNGKFGEPNLEKAVEYFKQGAESNSIQAVEILGYYYLGNHGEQFQDFQKGIECYQKASDMGSGWATVELGRCYQYSIGTDANFAKAVELYTKATENNYPYGFVMLGEFYVSGASGEPDYSKAFKYFSEAAKAEIADGYYSLGRMYKYAMGIEANPILATENFQKAMDKGNIDGKIEVALSYESGAGVEQDKDKAFELMQEMAEQNIPYAQYKLGAYYYYAFVKEDEEKGLEWFNKSYENGSSLAAIAMGEHYLYSSDENIDSKEAFKYFEYAANKNYISEGIGICYLYGLGVEENEEQAYKHFKIASERGYTAATYRLGLCYRDGLGTQKNEEKGHTYLLEAAEQNNIYSIYAVGMNFIKGRGVAANPKKGAEFLLKAAEREYSYAQYELANCFLEGNGVPADEEKAMYWYKKAADNGHKEAKDIIG